MASPNSQFSHVTDYFINRHVFLKDEWLDEVLRYLRDSNLPPEPLCKAVFEQWLHSDIAESTNPSFQKPNGVVGYCEGCFVMQIVSIVDIGTSFWTQYRNVTHVADNFDFFDAIPKEEIPVEVQQNEKSKKMMYFELTDGVTSIKAIEYRTMPEFNVHIPPGSKVLLYGKIKMRNGIFWLTEKNVQLLGGDLYSLCRKNRPEALLGRLLNMEKYKDEALPVTPEVNTQRLRRPSIPKSVARRPIQQVVHLSQRTPLTQVNVNIPNRDARQSLSSTRISNIGGDILPDVTMGSVVEQNSSVTNMDISNPRSVTQSTQRILETTPEVITEMSDVVMLDVSNHRVSDDSVTEILEQKVFDVDNSMNSTKSPAKDLRQVVPSTPESSPLQSPQAKKSKLSTMSTELEMPSEENEIVTKFKNLKLVKISEACRLMKFSIGAKKMRVLAIMVEEIDPFRTEDGEWTMTIGIRDESHSCLECLVAHELLCNLISMTPAEAIAVKNSTNVVKKREGKKRLESLYFQLNRLDLVFEIEFFSANRVMPKIVGLSTLYDAIFV